jgi:hypothetical protein
MTDEGNKKFTMGYTEGTSITMFTFDSFDESLTWQTDMMALKYEMEDVNETYITFDSRKCAAFARWLVKYNAFVRVWTYERTPHDIVTAKDSLVGALVSVNWPVPE